LNTDTTPLRAIIVTPEQAPQIKPFGLDMKVLLSYEASRGATSVLLAWHKAGEGPPDHVHFSQEEMFFIVAGTYEVTVADQTTTVGHGSLVFIPRNTVHRFRNIGETTGCMLDWTLPGGQDRYFRAIAELSADGSFNNAKVQEISSQFDTNFVAAR